MSQNKGGVSIYWVIIFASMWISAQVGRDTAKTQNTRLRDEIELLKKERDEWQRASWPAIEAREWQGLGTRITGHRDVTPEILGYALNPCYTTPAGNLNSSEPGCQHDYDALGVKKALSVPIKIVRVR